MGSIKPRHPAADRLRSGGCAGASVIDLISVALARREQDISEEMARNVLKHIGRIQMLAEIASQDLRDLAGLDDFEIIRAQALIELGRRCGIAGKGETFEIEEPADVMALFPHLRNEKREHFCTVLLDSKNKVLKVTTVHIGTVNASIVGPREVFREAIREGASSIIVVHNHPSGDPTPSVEDHQVTELLKDIGTKLDMPVLDHVIIGYKEGYSFTQRGYISWLTKM